MASVVFRANRVLPSASRGGSGDGTTETMFIDSGSVPIMVPLPLGGVLIGANAKKAVSMRLVAYGRVTTGASLTWTGLLYYHTSLTSTTLTAGNKISASSGVTVATASCPWHVQANLVWDSTSKKVQGWYQSVINGTVVSPTTLTNNLSSIDPDADTASGFVISSTFGTSNASNVAILDSFFLEVLREG